MRRSTECVFLSILLLLEVVVVVEGCSCYQDPDAEKAFKNADYGMLFKTNSFTRYYDQGEMSF